MSYQTEPFDCALCGREIEDMEQVQVGWANGMEWDVLCCYCWEPSLNPKIKDRKPLYTASEVNFK